MGKVWGKDTGQMLRLSVIEGWKTGRTDKGGNAVPSPDGACQRGGSGPVGGTVNRLRGGGGTSDLGRVSR
jgi:hypothetical protein